MLPRRTAACLVLLLLPLMFISAHDLTANAQDREEAALLTLINAYRNQSALCWNDVQWVAWPRGSARTLQFSAALARAALSHNLTMIAQNCFAHICPGEPSLDRRVEAAGYPSTWHSLWENLSAGYETASTAFGGWLDSEEHKQNALACQARAVGISRRFGAQTTFHWYWTVDFGDVLDTAPSNGGSPSLKSFDVNRNGRIDDPEFFAITDAWIAGRLDDATFFQAIDLWISQQNIST